MSIHFTVQVRKPRPRLVHVQDTLGWSGARSMPSELAPSGFSGELQPREHASHSKAIHLHLPTRKAELSYSFLFVYQPKNAKFSLVCATLLTIHDLQQHLSKLLETGAGR